MLEPDVHKAIFILDKSSDIATMAPLFRSNFDACGLDNPAIQDDDLARHWLESCIRPDGPEMPHCGSFGGVTRMQGKAHRAGCFQCNACRSQLTVTVGTVMERSKFALPIWVKAMYLLSASKKGMSTHQLHRMLCVSQDARAVVCNADGRLSQARLG